MRSPLLNMLLAMALVFSLAACSSSKKVQSVQQPMPGYAQPSQQPYAQQQQTFNPTAVYRLGSGDELRITIFGEENMTGTYKIDGAGMLAMPLIGNVMAGNLTVAELQMRIGQQLSQGFLVNPRVAVQVMNYRPFFILGEVNRPNQYPYVEGMKVINAVAMASGYTYRANENRMTIVRGNDPMRTKQAADPNSYVMPGDTIEIQERLF
jgi:protein involved in polysaccharide export with SLBB domain